MFVKRNSRPNGFQNLDEKAAKGNFFGGKDPIGLTTSMKKKLFASFINTYLIKTASLGS